MAFSQKRSFPEKDSMFFLQYRKYGKFAQSILRQRRLSNALPWRTPQQRSKLKSSMRNVETLSSRASLSSILFGSQTKLPFPSNYYGLQKNVKRFFSKMRKSGTRGERDATASARGTRTIFCPLHYPSLFADSVKLSIWLRSSSSFMRKQAAITASKRENTASNLVSQLCVMVADSNVT